MVKYLITWKEYDYGDTYPFITQEEVVFEDDSHVINYIRKYKSLSKVFYSCHEVVREIVTHIN